MVDIKRVLYICRVKELKSIEMEAKPTKEAADWFGSRSDFFKIKAFERHEKDAQKAKKSVAQYVFELYNEL